MSNVLNLTMKQGENFARVLTFRDQSNALIDLTGYSFKSQVREAYGKATAVFDFTLVLKDQVTNQGEVDWTCAASITEPLKLTESKVYVYDVEMASPSGIKTRVIEGKITMSPEVTKT